MKVKVLKKIFDQNVRNTKLYSSKHISRALNRSDIIFCVLLLFSSYCLSRAINRNMQINTDNTRTTMI